MGARLLGQSALAGGVADLVDCIDALPAKKSFIGRS
jgi:hypothetical protein